MQQMNFMLGLSPLLLLRHELLSLLMVTQMTIRNEVVLLIGITLYNCLIGSALNTLL
jgi:hypothetical protein